MNPDPGSSGLNVYLNGVPAAGYTTTSTVTFEGISIASGTHLNAFDVTAASVGCPAGSSTCATPWEAQDQDVIGAGSYKFVHWEAGNFVKLDKNPNYFIADATVRAKYPATLVLQVPKVDSIIYRLYRNVQATVFALQAGTLDFIDWTVPPDQVAPITGDPNIGLKSSADAGFFYQSFNFDRLPFGYLNPAEGSNTPGNDIGKPFRLAVAHATDKRTIVTSLLQNFGVAGHTVVSPTNTLYYNASAPRYEFDPSVARGILDAAYGVWPGGVCQQDGTGCRSLPGKGTSAIDMLTPQADYDPTGAVGTKATQLWKWTQGAILQDAVYNVLYFRTNVFAFRQDRINPASFRTDIGGDVWIYWSRILLEPAPPGVIRSAASLPSAVGSGGNAPITVTVRKSDGSPVQGAFVNISRTSGLGTVSPSTGTTNENGQPAAGANVILTPSPAITLTPSTFTLDATGHQQVTVSAPTVAADTTYTITITATRGAVSGTSQMTLTVLNVPPSPGGGLDN